MLVPGQALSQTRRFVTYHSPHIDLEQSAQKEISGTGANVMPRSCLHAIIPGNIIAVASILTDDERHLMHARCGQRFLQRGAV
jgi:hypothetical protein